LGFAIRVVAVLAASGWLTFPAQAHGSVLLVVNGRGWGNGIGLSQWGAEGYAQHGWSYQDIVAHYYPHTTIGSASDRPVRVLLAQDKTEVTVGSTAPFLLIDSNGRVIHMRTRSLRLTPGLRLGGRALVAPVTVKPSTQPLTLDGTGYRGSLLLERNAGGLTIVNTLPLERYLRGVVPSEMPQHWAAAAYEAQTVAARSYALASLHPAATFDLYATNRSQVYGGIRSERPETNLAVGATAGEVLTYDDRVITAYYDSDSGGRTAAIQDVFSGQPPEPYLVAVSDPFDGASPHHRWRVALGSAELSQLLHAPVSDVRVLLNASGRASSVRLLAGRATRTLAATTFSTALGLRSTYFTIGVASLSPPSHTPSSGRLTLRGFVRGLTSVVLQQRLPTGSWVQVRHVVTTDDGRFVETVSARHATAYRLAVDRIAGPAVDVRR
jgi:stage II sporulation protein D